MFSMVCEFFSFLKDMNCILMVLSRPGRWRWWDWCTPQPHNAPPNPSLSGMWGSSLRVMGLARLIIVGRLLLLTLVVLSNPEQPTTLFMLCVHPPRLSWKKDQNTNLCILSNIYVVLRFWECAFLLCGFHRSLFRNISSQFGRLLCWSATSCELHPIPLLWKCQGRFNKKGVGSNVQRLFCSIPTQLPPPMQWLLVDGFVDS